MAKLLGTFAAAERVLSHNVVLHGCLHEQTATQKNEEVSQRFTKKKEFANV